MQPSGPQFGMSRGPANNNAAKTKRASFSMTSPFYCETIAPGVTSQCVGTPGVLGSSVTVI